MHDIKKYEIIMIAHKVFVNYYCLHDSLLVEFYLYPTVSTALIHLIKPGLMK